MKFHEYLYIFILISIHSFLTTSVILESSFLSGNNSDLLYPAMFLTDIQTNINFLQAWVLTPAPSIFPDLLLYYILDWGDIGVTLYLYTIIFTLLFFNLLSKLISKYKKDFSMVWVLLLLTIVNICLTYNKKLIYFYLPTYHSSIYLFGLYLFLIQDSKDRKEIFLMYLLSFLFGISDLFVILQIIFPLLFFNCTTNFKDKYLLTRNILFYSRTFLFAVIGKLFINGLHKNKILIVPDVPIFKSFYFIVKNMLFMENIQKSFQFLLAEGKEFYFLYFLIILFILYFFVNNRINKNILWTFLFSSLILFIFQGWFGIWIGYRYMWFFYIYPVVFLSFYLLLSIKNNFPNFFVLEKEKYIYLFILILILSQFHLNLDKISKIIFFYRNSKENIYSESKINFSVNYKIQKIIPKRIECITKISKKYLLSFGISDYWNAKYVTYFSNNELRVNQFTEDLKPYYWINNKELYKSNNDFIRYDFILTNRLSETVIRERIGVPTVVEYCEDISIWIYKNGFQLKVD